MISLHMLLYLTHLLGLALGLGAATVKLILLLKAKADPEFVPAFLKVVRLITKPIILGLILLTLSGAARAFLGYPLRPLLIFKIVLVVAIWAIGPIIDNVVEPKFQRLAPAPGQSATPAFMRVLNQYVALEVTADVLFYGVAVLGVVV